jgi:hypothetical protein
MKIKLALAAACVLLSSACVSTSNQYRNDIVYRDGSYYSPADDQNGDYYYAPEQDYDYGYDYGYYSDAYDRYYYDNHYSPWYGYSNSRRCRYSYRYDRDCSFFGWGGSSLHFGGFTLIISTGYGRNYGYDRGYYDYGYRQPSYGYGNHYGSSYGYSGHSYGYGSPYYGGGYHSSPYYYYPQRPRPQTPTGPVAMPKPSRPNNPVIDNSVNTNPGVRVSGGYAMPQTQIRMGRRDGESPQSNSGDGISVGGQYAAPQPQQPRISRIDQSPRVDEQAPQTSARPGVWRAAIEADNAARNNNKQPVRVYDDSQQMPVQRERVRMRAPMPVIISNEQADAREPYARVERQQPVQQERMQPKPRQVVVIEREDRSERYEQPAPQPRYERVERAPQVERVERVERVQYVQRAEPVENNKGPRRVEESEENR